MDTEIHASPEELELLTKFRKLSAQGQRFILCTADDARLLYPIVVRPPSNILQFVPALVA